MHYRKLLATIFAGIVCALPAWAAEPPVGDAEQQLDAYIATQMQEAGIAGAGAAILVDGQVVWTQGYGYANLAATAPFTPDTVMNIGSISKTVLGVALMRAVQDGLLSLDADINTYLPFKLVNPHQPDAVITLRQLATHTSGIRDRYPLYTDSYRYGDDQPEALDHFLRSYFVPGGEHYRDENFLDVRPGTYRDYSNIGAGLAGYIVERATGDTLGAYARRMIFAPLGMRATGWSLAEVDRARHATLYVAQNGMTIPIPHYNVPTYPDGGVRTSVNDLSRLFAALLNDGAYQGVRILDAATVREMLRFHYTEANKPENVELDDKNSGIFWQSKFNVTRIGHGGVDPGVNTEMLSSLSRDIGVVLFVNTSVGGEGIRAYLNIFEALWKHAQIRKAATRH